MLSRSEIEGALADLVAELTTLRRPVTIYIVGGTALMLGFGARQATRDVDAVVAPPDDVLRAASKVAQRRALPDDWLSTAASMFVPPHPEDPNPTLFLQKEGVRVEIASAEWLLGMKIRASRGRQDIDDIRLLLDITDVRTVDGAVAVYDRVYEEDPIGERSLLILRELLC
jgi:hypothetical protein